MLIFVVFENLYSDSQRILFCREILQLMSTLPIKKVDFEDILEPKVRAYQTGRNC